jgi:cephalosporin hydroxylase
MAVSEYIRRAQRRAARGESYQRIALRGAQAGIAAALRRGTRGLRQREFLRELVVRTDNFRDVTWLGHPILQNVLDLWCLQEAISEIRPALLLETGTNRGGSALFYAHLFDLLGHGRVVTVDVERMHELEHPRIDFLIGSSVSDATLDRMRAASAAADGPVIVVLDSDHGQEHVADELEAYQRFVTPGSLLLCQDGLIDELPKFRESRPGPLPAIHEFLIAHPEFAVDERYNRRFFVTHHPDGWLRRR